MKRSLLKIGSLSHCLALKYEFCKPLSLAKEITFNSQLAAARIQVRWQPDGEWKDVTLLQCLANLSEQESKLELLKLLLNHG